VEGSCEHGNEPLGFGLVLWDTIFAELFTIWSNFS
jgi:hypothetical protein